LKAQEVERRVCQEGIRKSFEKDTECKCAQGQGQVSFTRSSGGIVVLSFERKYLEKLLSFEELKCSKVERRKTEVRRKNKYGELSQRNPSEKNFEEWIRSRVKIHSGGAEIFQAIRSQRSSALVSCEELSKFRKTKGFGRSKVKFKKS
jgi:hypothetical protein